MSEPLPIARPAEVRTAAVRELRADRRSVLTLVVVNVLASAVALVAPWLLGRIIDTIQAGPDDVLDRVDRLALAALAFTVAQILLTRWSLLVGHRFGERAGARIRQRLLDRVLALPARRVERVGTGDLVSRGSTDATVVATTLRAAVPEIVVAAIQALFLVVAVVVLDPRLGAFGLLGIIGVAIALRRHLRRARDAYLEVAASGAELADVVTTTVRGARTVELLGLEQRRTRAAESSIGRARRAQLDALWLRTVLFPWSDIALGLPVVGVLAVGGLLHLDGMVSLGTVVAATVYLRQLVGPLDTLMVWIEQLQAGGASYARVEGIPATTPKPPAVGVPDAVREAAGDRLQVDDVRYGYLADRDVLHGVDLLVRPGEHLAIVGGSGAGKSTLARLLAGVDHPRTGTVTIDGTAVADLPPEQLRGHVVLVTQEHHVFSDSLRDNLLLARPSADDDQVWAALSAVGATWAADLPVGLDAVAGRDVHLDDAMAQQLSLARVVLADPHTLILDEATAQLDPGTARDTERSLAAVLQGRTVIAIAHRLQTARDADRIVVMADGRIVEVGTHDDLVAAGQAYARLWQAWHGDSG
ncbi:MAG TPA: ABC transporter ATP-binding protein [Candidatus Avipropionibacterium avicola]|uniref:ABC transporter ATP-binding protein n=1 Tax=Candidatus Avipropionibacterium avicola TaxID=2840701 RepID=A0A9D1KQ42_9ACTN|nr:ABC transporter ATP-binding protein [Candidatus Avipropionibacterium avicola]